MTSLRQAPSGVHAHDYDGGRADGRRGPTPSVGWTGTIVRLLFGVIWAIDAYLKWLPGYRSSYISNLKSSRCSCSPRRRAASAGAWIGS